MAEDDYSDDGYVTTKTGDTGTIAKDGTSTAVFTNTKDVTPPEPDTGNLTVSKVVAGNAGETDEGFRFTCDPQRHEHQRHLRGYDLYRLGADFTLKHGESKTATGLPAGITYTVAEDDYSDDGYVTTKTGDTGTIAKDGTSTAVFTNTKDVTPPEPDTGNLTVSKVVAGNAGETDEGFRFTVTLSDTSINDTFGDMTFTDGVADFTLKHGESKTATGLPAGITYTVAEDDYSDDGYVTTKTGDTGTIAKDGTSTAVFTNTKDVTPPEPDTGNLTVSKVVAGNAGETDEGFRFTVTLSDTSINDTFGDMTFTDGVADFTLKHGESKTATGLPAGITYTVAEDDYSDDGYVTTKTGDTGTIAKDGTSTAVFTNTKDVTPPEPDTGNLTVSKVVAGNAGETDEGFRFTVTLSDTSINDTFGDMTFTDGVADFTLKHGESKTATGLPAGITYTVAEDDYSDDGYVTTKTGDTGTIAKDGTSTAVFTNTKDVTPIDPDPDDSSLTVKKDWIAG